VKKLGVEKDKLSDLLNERLSFIKSALFSSYRDGVQTIGPFQSGNDSQEEVLMGWLKSAANGIASGASAVGNAVEGTFSHQHSLPPHPDPLPQGEGAKDRGYIPSR
jgi:hypothetical protein